MAALTDHSRNALLDHTLRGDTFTAPINLWMGLLTSPANAASPGTEVAGGGYVRQPVTFASAANGEIATASACSWEPVHASADAYVCGIGFYDASASGNLLAWETFSQSRLIAANTDASILAGATIASRGTGISDTLADAWLNHLCAVAPYTPPAERYLGLYSIAPTRDTTGTELSGAGGYAAQVVGFDPASSGESVNASAVLWKPLDTDDDQTINGWAVTDGSGVLFFGTVDAATIAAGLNARVVVGGLAVGAS